MTVVRLE